MHVFQNITRPLKNQAILLITTGCEKSHDFIVKNVSILFRGLTSIRKNFII